MIVCFGWATYKNRALIEIEWAHFRDENREALRFLSPELFSHRYKFCSSVQSSSSAQHSTLHHKAKGTQTRGVLEPECSQRAALAHFSHQWRAVCALQAENVMVTLRCSYEVFWLLVTYRVALLHYKEQHHYLKLNVFGFLVFWYKNNIAWAERNKRANQLSMLTVWVEMDIQYEQRWHEHGAPLCIRLPPTHTCNTVCVHCEVTPLLLTCLCFVMNEFAEHCYNFKKSRLHIGKLDFCSASKCLQNGHGQSQPLLPCVWL